MGSVLRKLLDTLDYSKIQEHTTADLSNTIPKKELESLEGEINHAWLWPRVGQWLREGDVVITETLVLVPCNDSRVRANSVYVIPSGTSSFGIWETRFPKDVTAISQVLWGSIGYSVGALQGAALACKEDFPNRRVILFVGDGSLQLTVQEISTMIRHGLKPIIFVLNNGGYSPSLLVTRILV